MDVLEAELQTYTSHHEQLLQEYAGRYVLIKDAAISGIFEKQYDAISEGYRRFGNVPFFVKKINGGRIPRLAK